MTRLEPIDLAEQIIRAVEAGELGDVAREKEDLSPLEILGGKIRAMRRKMGLKPGELSTLAHVDEHLLLAIELGVATPEKVYQNLPALGEALGGRYAELSQFLIRITLTI